MCKSEISSASIPGAVVEAADKLRQTPLNCKSRLAAWQDFPVGVRLAGVEAIVAEGFERIHRTNLVGMGVLPLEFVKGEDRHTYAIDGTELFAVIGTPTAGAALTVVVTRTGGETVEIPVTCRLDTAEEVSIYEAGGVLQRFAQDFLESVAAV